MSLTQSAVTARDVTAVVSLYHENACLTTGSGGFAIGRQAIAEHLGAVLPLMPTDIVHDVKSAHIHYVTPDLAICDSIGETHRTSSVGDEARSVEAFTMIAVHDQGEWQWAGLRAIMLPK
jgi:uncharacterized protein (TIGR02246 family)